MRMKASVIVVVGAVVFTAVTVARGQAPPRPARIAMVCGVRCEGPVIEAFWQTLREAGRVEGRNLVRDVRGAEGEYDRLPGIMQEVVDQRPDIIVAVAPQPARAAKLATSAIPIVMLFVADPVLIGLVPSLSHPGANITGVTTLPARGFIAKQVELLKELQPAARRIAVLWNSTNEIHRANLPLELPSAAQRLGVQFQMLDVRGPAEIEQAFEAAVKEQATTMLVVGDPVFHNPPRRLPDLALRHRLPTMFLFREAVQAGALMAYGPDLVQTIRRGALQVDRILKGTKPGDIPMEQPDTFRLVLNARTAKALGMTIPSSLLLRADEVIE
jgi:putative ABC transport system substrate-binding protein